MSHEFSWWQVLAASAVVFVILLADDLWPLIRRDWIASRTDSLLPFPFLRRLFSGRGKH